MKTPIKIWDSVIITYPIIIIGRRPNRFKSGMQTIPDNKFTIPIIYEPVLGVKGNFPFVSAWRVLMIELANVVTGPSPLSMDKIPSPRHVHVALAYSELSNAYLKVI